MIPKQYILIAAILACVFAFGFGYKTGGNAVRVEYQSALNDQKAIADEMIQENIKQVQSTVAENEKIKKNLEIERRANAKTTNDLRSKLANDGLRFFASCAKSGSNAMSTESNAADNAGAANVQLPEKIATSLRELAFDCDTLKDDYNLLYNFNQELQ